jgi:3-hydroxy-9,10-secoandrosta-1,3,5(10)-triene-9,17-dione monooxygenase
LLLPVGHGIISTLMIADHATSRLDAVTARAQARTLVPVFAERSATTESMRRVPDETIADLRDLGLFRVQQPARYGGSELGFITLFELGVELSRACTSAGWVYSVLASHSWVVGQFPLTAQDDVWGSDPDALIASSIGTDGPVMQPSAGGFLVERARYAFSSGCDSAAWFLLVGRAATPSGDLAPHWYLVPRDDVTIVDDWFVAGLRGTGSKSIELEDVFVPAHRLVPLALLAAGRGPGRDVNAHPIYGVPLRVGLQFSLVAPGVGGVLGAVDALAARLRRRGADGEPGMQMRLGRAIANAEAVRAIVTRNEAEVLDIVEAGGTIPLPELHRYRLDLSHGMELCLDAVELLFRAGGGTSLADGDPLQRFWRDVHAAAAHRSFNLDATATEVGRIALGLDPTPMG